MKQIIKNLTLLSLATIVLVACEKEESHNEFSVNIGKTVEFAKGNLQYQASTGSWRFADHQYDFAGSDNSNISPSYDGWIDLFGWGTSGWESGAIAHHPYDTSTNYEDYYVGNDPKFDLTGNYAKADWGVSNNIINGNGQWRTLSPDEWKYIFSYRTDAGKKYGIANIDGVNGIVLLPDKWKSPKGVSFTNGGTTTNNYTTSQWSKMESAGAIFIPTASYRAGTDIKDVGKGFYWTTSMVNSRCAYYLYIDGSYVDIGSANRSCGLSVRLVRDL